MNSKTEVVIHHDDLGASHSANMAFAVLWDEGLISAGSIMVPCPWFPEIATMARPDHDLGVHLTLTSEFEGFRWRPLTGVADNGLADADGFMWKDVASARKADPAAVEAELRAQIDTALEAGIDVTHLDTHMLSACTPEFIGIYERLGADYDLPIVVARDRLKGDKDIFAPVLMKLETRGNPIFDTFPVTPFGNPDPKAEDYAGIFDKLGMGVHYGAFHFAAPGDIEMISPDASTRIGEWNVFRSGVVREMLKEMGIEPIGMRAIRDRMRGG